MPRIPTIDSSVSIGTGSTGPFASPDSFGGGSGLAALGQGMSNLGVGVSDVGQILEQRKEQDGVSWNVESQSQYVRDIAAFAVDTENQSKPTYAQDLDAFAKERLGAYLEKAPSPKAAERFRAWAINEADRYFLRAQGIAERLRIGRLEEGVGTQMMNFMAEYRMNVSQVGSDQAGSILNSRLTDVLAGLEDTFQEMPESKSKLEAFVYEQAILGTAEETPELAKSLLSDAPIDESRRRTLRGIIDSAQQESNDIARTQFNLTLKREEDIARDTLTPMPVHSEGEFKAIFGDEQGAARYQAYREVVDQINIMIETVNELSTWNIAEQTKAFNQKVQKARDSGDAVAIRGLREAANRLKEIQEWQAKDAVGYLKNYNPVVKRLGLQMQNAGTDDEKLAILATMREKQLQFQGPPPADADPATAKMYLDLPLMNRSVMDKTEATDWANKFKSATPQTIFQTIQEFESSFGLAPDPTTANEQVRNAFDDLVTLPDSGSRLDPEYQLALLIHGMPYLPQYIGALQNEDAIKSLSEERFQDYEEALFNDRTWIAFDRGLTVEGAGLSGDIAAFKSGIIKFAASQYRHETASDAIKKAVAATLGVKMKGGEVNGTPFMMLKESDSPNVPPPTDEDVEKFMDSADRLIQEFEFSQVSLEQNGINLFPLVPEGKEEQEIYWRTKRDDLFLRPTRDGRGGILYLVGDEGFSFELRDKNNQPFVLRSDKWIKIMPDRTDLEAVQRRNLKRMLGSDAAVESAMQKMRSDFAIESLWWTNLPNPNMPSELNLELKR